MASIYELKMPSYLAMSKGDLIAEIIEHGEIVSAHLASAHEHDTPTLMSIEHPDDVPQGIKDSSEVVRIANDVLRERFGITIDFHYGEYGL